MRSIRTAFSRGMAWPMYKALLRPVVRRAHRRVPEARAWFACSQDEADAQQLRHLWSLLQESGRNVPYYRDLFERIGFSPNRLERAEEMEAIPPLDRETVQARCADLCTDRDDLALHQNASGGSSGSPVIVYQTDAFRVAAQASAIAADMMAGYQPGRPAASLWGAPTETRRMRSVLRRAAYWVLNYRLFDAFDMDELRMVEFHRRLSRFRPDVLVCYASSLHIFARFLASEGLEPTYPTRALIASAEVLTPRMREDIKTVFGCPLFDRYGSRETGILAMECPQHAGIHVMGQNVYVEVVDPETMRPVEGEPGEVLVTTLHNYGMPLIRYRLGDEAVLTHEPCSCGWPGPRILRIVGRTSDTIRVASGRLIHGEYFTHLLYGVEGVREFRFVQEDPNRYSLLLVTNARYDRAHDEELRREIRKVVGQDAVVEVGHVDRLEPLPSGKRQFVVSRRGCDKAPRHDGTCGQGSRVGTNH